MKNINKLYISHISLFIYLYNHFRIKRQLSISHPVTPFVLISIFFFFKKHKNCLQVTSALGLTKIPSEFKMQAQKQQLQWALVHFKTALD